MTSKHSSANPSHYDYAADKYDVIYEQYAEIDDELIANILRKKKVSTVLDLTCGTGAQVIYLAQNKFEVTGSDINQKMLNVAKKKAKKLNLQCKLHLGDMRTCQVGQFDSVITIFNSIGHLTKPDFIKALKNISGNLKPGGVYVFDIFNLNYMQDGRNISNLTIDFISQDKNRVVRKIQYSTVDHKGVLASYTTSIVQPVKSARPIESKGSQTLQIYSVDELNAMLQKCGFKLLHKYGIDGSRFSDKKTKHMLLVAQKIALKI